MNFLDLETLQELAGLLLLVVGWLVFYVLLTP